MFFYIYWFFLYTQEEFRAKQANIFAALDKLYILHNAILAESRFIKAFFFYCCIVFLIYMLTSAKQTFSIRGQLYFGIISLQKLKTFHQLIWMPIWLTFCPGRSVHYAYVGDWVDKSWRRRLRQAVLGHVQGVLGPNGVPRRGHRSDPALHIHLQVRTW